MKWRFRHFPWATLALLLLLTWSLGLVASLWVQAFVNTLAAKLTLTDMAGWGFTFATYFPGEPWADAAILLVGIPFGLWRWWVLGRALWDRWR